MDNLVTVIVPAHNAEAYLANAIQSALDQAYPNIEIIVVDDGSTDRTPQIIESFGNRVIPVHLDRQGGAGRARNHAIRMGHGDLIAFLDADDIWTKDKIACQVEELKRNPNQGLCYTDVQIYDEKMKPMGLWSGRRPCYSGNIFRHLFIENFICISSAVVRKRTLDKVGVFNENMLNATDYDLFLRICKTYEIGFINRVLVKYLDRINSLSKNFERRFQTGINISEAAIRDNPDYFRNRSELIQRRFGLLHYRFGWRYFHIGQFRKSREQFVLSLKHRPWHLRTGLFFLATYLPAWAIKGIRKIKRVIQRVQQDPIHT